jgi:hypothetical protein
MVSIAVGTCLQNHFLETALVYLLILQSLHSNGSTCYSIIRFLDLVHYLVL